MAWRVTSEGQGPRPMGPVDHRKGIFTLFQVQWKAAGRVQVSKPVFAFETLALAASWERVLGQEWEPRDQ